MATGNRGVVIDTLQLHSMSMAPITIRQNILVQFHLALPAAAAQLPVDPLQEWIQGRRMKAFWMN